MTPITYHLTLDLKRDLHQVLVMKEGDANTRTVKITITDNGEKFIITDQRITLKWKKPDHYKVQNDCTKVDASTVSFHCTDQMLAVPGIAKAELCMFDKTGHLLSTMPFQVSIKPAAVTDSDVASSNEFKTLLKLFDEFKTEHDRIKAEVLKDKKDAENARDLSISYAHGHTGIRNGEDTDNSKYYKEEAERSSNRAESHANNSQSSANASASSASAAASSANSAAASKTQAEQQASNASSSAATASTKAQESSNSAALSKSYAMGGTGKRTNEDTDNSKYYYQQSKDIYDDFSKANTAGIVSTGYLQEHFVPDYVSSAEGAVTGKGWYRIAKAIGGHDTNSCVISIKRGYNSPAPEYQKVQFMTAYTYKKLVSLAAYSMAHIWTKMRYTRDSANSTEYIEIYQDRDTYSNSWVITIEDALSAYSNNWKAITPTLTSETVSGVTVYASLNLPSYFDLDFLLRTGGGELTGVVGLKGAGRFTYHADASTEYARGFEYRNSSGAVAGGIGAHGKNGEFSKIYLGIGSSNPFTDSAGLTIRSNSIQWKGSNVVTENSGAASRVSDAGNKTAISFQYSGSGLNSSSWIAAWDGYKIGAIAPSKITGVGSAIKATQDSDGKELKKYYAKSSYGYIDDCNTFTNGFACTQSSTKNTPSSGANYHGIIAVSSTMNDSKSYIEQIAISESSNPDMYFRSIYSGTANSWKKVITEDDLFNMATDKLNTSGVVRINSSARTTLNQVYGISIIDGNEQIGYTGLYNIADTKGTYSGNTTLYNTKGALRLSTPISDAYKSTKAGSCYVELTTVKPYAGIAGTHYTIHLPNNDGTLSVASSDKRLKDHIQDTKINALPIINKIKFREFDWNNKSINAHQEIGVVADELEEIDPHLVLEGTGGWANEEQTEMNVKCVDTFYLMGYYGKAIQELSDLVNQQQEEIACLKNELSSLKQHQ